MKMKYFICSDIHSYYDEWMQSLKSVGFDIENKSNVLIVLGDLFDRGDKSREVYKFVKSVPKSRRILIKGNHEDLLLQCLQKEFPESFDFHNGTVKTICHLSNVSKEDYDLLKWGNDLSEYAINDSWAKLEIKPIINIWKSIRNKFNNSSIVKWLKGDEWLNYYETDKYIMTHAFIPLTSIRESDDSDKIALDIYYNRNKELKVVDNWREQATDEQWDNARWGCPYKFIEQGFFDKELPKKLICGHWSARDFHTRYENLPQISDDIYIGDKVIALDACTILSKQVNTLVIDGGGNIL